MKTVSQRHSVRQWIVDDFEERGKGPLVKEMTRELSKRKNIAFLLETTERNKYTMPTS